MDSSVVIILLALSSGLSNLFVYCYFGMLATEYYEQMSDYLYYTLTWPEMPIKLQKYLILLIGNMQRPIHYHGFEIAKLSLRTFIEVRTIFFKFCNNDLCAIFFSSSSEWF